MKAKIAKGTLYSITILTFLIVIVSLIHPFLSPAKYYGIKDDVIGDINSDSIIKQKFGVIIDDLDFIEIKYTNFGSAILSGEMAVEIFNSENEKIYYNVYQLAEIQDNTTLRFEFGIQKNVVNQDFTLVITTKDLEKGAKFSFYNEEKSVLPTSDNLKLNSAIGMNLNGEQRNYYYSVIFLFLFLIEVFVVSIVSFKNKEFVNRKWYIRLLYVGGLVLISCLFAYSFLDVQLDLLKKNSIPLLSLPIFVLCAILILMNIAYHMVAKNVKLEKLFLALAIPFSCMYLLYIVPGIIPDEIYHYRVAYKISTGDIFVKGNETPKAGEIKYNNYYDVKDNIFKVQEEPTEMVNIDQTHYSPLLYLLSSFGIFVGRLFHLTVLGTKYVGSFFNMLLFLISGYYFIKWLPFGKYFGIVYLLSPMAIQQATSLSCDAVINATCLLFIAYLLKLHHSEEKLNTKDILIVSILALFVLSCKNAYFPLLLLFLLIKKNIKKTDKKKKWLFFGAILFIFSLTFGSFALRTLKNYVTTNTNNSIVETIEVPQQSYTKLSYILTNPTKLGAVIINTIKTNLDFYILSFGGRWLGSLDINIQDNIIIIYLILLTLTIFFDSEKSKLTRNDKILMGITLCINIIIIMLGLFVGWGDTRGFVVEGVQGRYFIPIFVLLFMLFSSNKVKFDINNKNIIITCILCYIHFFAILNIMGYYGI